VGVAEERDEEVEINGVSGSCGQAIANMEEANNEDFLCFGMEGSSSLEATRPRYKRCNG
jgi:hypothetical protein